VVLVPPVDELDLVGPLQVFSSVNRLAGRSIYSIEIVTTAEGLAVDGESGVLTFIATNHFANVDCACDSVLLVCGLESRAVRDPALSAWLNRVASKVRRLGAVCVGAFLLAEAGLLDGRRATAHWRFGLELASRFPQVRVEHEPLWVRDGNIYTCAGISAGIDLALAWVEEDLGAAAALTVARELVLFLRRPASQSQISVSLQQQAVHTRPMHELQVWMAEHVHRPLSVSALAERVAMSPRNFARVFAHEFGTTPGRYLLRLRVEAARRLLEQTDRSLEQVADASGFRSVDVLRRAMQRAVGTTPARYRRHFRTPATRADSQAGARRTPLVAARSEIAIAARFARRR
jgi:transcriptional regulator GlxA family with amidase domain